MEKLSGSKMIRGFFYRLLRVGLIIGAAVVVAFVLFKSKKPPEKVDLVKAAPAVRAVKAAAGKKTMEVSAFGTVKPKNRVRICVEVSGRIEYINPGFVAGGFIAKGDCLAGIDQRTYHLDREAARIKILQIQAQINRQAQDIENLKKDIVLARTNTELAQKELDRITALTRNEFASITSLDKARQQHLAARIQLQAVENSLALQDPLMAQQKAALAMAETDFQKADLAFEKTKVYAPFDGFVLEKSVEVGELVSPGQLLGAIYEKGLLEVDVAIPLEEIQWIQEGLSNGKLPMGQVSMANMEGPVYPARVARIKAQIDEKTRTLPMTLEILSLNPDQEGSGPFLGLKPGSFVECRTKGLTYDHIFVLPRDLLKPGDCLFLVRENRLEIRKVTVLRKFEDRVYITRGLEDGDLIISSPLPGAVDGMALTVKGERGAG